MNFAASVIGTVYLAFLITLSNRGGWLGYAAGIGDHNVLMPVGIRAAIPEAFKNDWFIDSAPQPHWFFDLIIQSTVRAGVVDYALFTYWLIGVAAFALATVLIARLFAPSRPFLTSALVLTLAGLAPWGLFGTGTGTIGMALPTVLAGNLIYLTIVLLMRGNLVSAAALGVVVAIVHVQQGSIIAIIFVVTIALQWFINRRVVWPLVFGLVGTAALVVFGLRIRPVASNPGDFVEVCNEVIPYHCAISLWHWPVQFAAIGGFLIAALTVLALRPPQRLIWASTAGLVILGYALGFAADALRVPVIGDLAQSVNANRLGSIIVPFMLWGLIFPLLELKSLDRYRERKGSLWALWGVWAGLAGMTLLDPSWNVTSFVLEHRGLVLLIGAIGGFLLLASYLWKRDLLPWAPVLALVALCIASAVVAGTITARPSVNWYERGEPSAAKEWYLEAGRIVPPGEIITAPGNSDSLRLYSQRATIVDCKNVPYGGQAWKDWKARTADLGIDCKNYFGYGPDMTPDQLEDIAEKYSSRYVIVDTDFVETFSDEIHALGWTLELEPNNIIGWNLFKVA